MSEQKHSPGALRAARILGPICISGYHIFNESNCEGCRKFVTATAEIIDRETAAPCLLEALKLMVDMWNSGDSHNSSKRAQQRRVEMWEKVKAAIAKAEVEAEGGK